MIVRKDEDDKIVVAVNWSRWLGSSIIDDSVWEETSGTLTISSAANNTTVASCYVSGGLYDREYWIKNTITTNDAIPRIESRSIKVRVLRKQ